MKNGTCESVSPVQLAQWAQVNNCNNGHNASMEAQSSTRVSAYSSTSTEVNPLLGPHLCGLRPGDFPGPNLEPVHFTTTRVTLSAYADYYISGFFSVPGRCGISSNPGVVGEELEKYKNLGLYWILLFSYIFGNKFCFIGTIELLKLKSHK